MAIDDTGDSGSDDVDSGDVGPTEGDPADGRDPATVGEYSWTDLREEFHSVGAFDRSTYLGFDPEDLPSRLDDGATRATRLDSWFEDYYDLETTPVAKDEYTWWHFKREYYFVDEWTPPREDGEVVPFEPSEHLGFEPEDTESVLSAGESRASELADLVDRRTVNVNEDLDEDEFFSDRDGYTTVVNRYDLERSVPMAKKRHFVELERYWVNKPESFAILFHSKKENEKKYYVVEPHLNPIEEELKSYISKKLRSAIKYSEDDVIVQGSETDRADVIEQKTMELLERYDLYGENEDAGFVDQLKETFGMADEAESEDGGPIEGISARPEHAILEEDPDELNQYQVEKLLYVLTRDFVGYGRIDPIKHDINVEDISCDGYESRVFVYHTDYEQVITNVEHGTDELDEFVVKLAQRSGKGISKRQPQVDATLPDGSRAQLTLGREVSDHGTNYTIRQFKDVPFTPVDLINWNTFNLDEMAFLWLCIENNKSLIFAGGTASGKTTSLNAVSLFIPSNSKIVSIEDTREVELPQRNWVASVTRPSFGEEDSGDVDEFDLLEAALRQRPDYIVMGEVRGEEGRTLFQVMSTGHTTYTTFHADAVGEVIKRFTTDPINVSKTLFTALDLVSVQTQTRVDGRKVRRNKTLTEINEYSAENDEINVRDVYEWRAETDEFLQMGNSNTLEEIKFDRGWSQDRLDEELFKRKVVLAYLIDEGLNTYTEVAATVQAFINDPDTIMTLIASDDLEESLADLREMESVEIDIDPAKEELVPRPEPSPSLAEETEEILENAGPLFERFEQQETPDIVKALTDVADEDGEEEVDEVDFGEFVPKAGEEAADET